MSVILDILQPLQLDPLIQLFQSPKTIRCEKYLQTQHFAFEEKEISTTQWHLRCPVSLYKTGVRL